ncbi:hypothetical protein FN846DRAFT_903778 [Sphaerosporella brunnea]|uniref:Fungal-type protein kinase domain-containing protein n=1 Tax=Sphaerosporella brunnea TaxID=1250544 RepID=A0A5J5F5S0_9PEZI|nr:hypothetical protein FN846DRAFT_903778 [Sphaerosporella brunnea]
MSPRRTPHVETPPKTPLNRTLKRTIDKGAASSPIALKTFLTDFAATPPPVASTVRPCKNTRNKAEYSHTDIAYPVRAWPEFSLASCIAKFGTELQETRVSQLPVDITPHKQDDDDDDSGDDDELTSELCVGAFTARSLTVHVNRALRACGYRMRDRTGPEVEGLKADRVGMKFPAREIRVVGDIKVSWKWRSEWRNAPPGTTRDIEYRQVLSQVHAYMNKTACRWGYVLTDHEFLAVERGDKWGDIRVADAVAWDSDGPWNVAFAAWFLHALAAGAEWHLARTTKRSGAVARCLVAGSNIDGAAAAGAGAVGVLRRSARIAAQRRTG